MRKIITQEILNDMLNDYHNGLGLIDLSNKYDFQEQSIQRIFKKVGIRITRGKSIPFSTEELSKIIDDYKSGMKPFELGKKYERNPATIIGKLQSMGVYENSNYRFTNEDIEFLKIHYPLGNWDKIFERFPNISKQSIYTKMSKLNITADDFYEEKTWTEKELNILKENYKYGNIDYLCQLLPNRGYKAITTKARRIGLKTRELWTTEEQEILKSNYHYMSIDDIMKLLPNRSRNSIISQAKSLNLVSVCKYNDYENDFVKQNWQRMSDREMEELLNKPFRSVTFKRHSLGLYRVKDESSYNDLSEYVRRNNLDWKKKSIINCGYKCILTGKRFDDIHHIYGLNLILNEVLNELCIDIKDKMDNYTDKELRDILDLFRIKQDRYPLGVCLAKDVHMLFHNKYGYGNNTEIQWNEFVTDFKNGKYDKELNVA